MKRLKFLMLFSICLLASCAGIRSYDRLVYYQSGYDPHYTPRLRTDGFYYRIESVCTSVDPVRYVDHYRPLYFYPDGAFAIGLMHPTLVSLRTWNTDRNAGYPSWGFYIVSNDVVRMEWINRKTGMSSCIAERNTMEARLVPDGLVLYSARDRNDRERQAEPEVFSFMVFDAKPDESLNWIKSHPNYRITKNDGAQRSPRAYPSKASDGLTGNVRE